MSGEPIERVARTLRMPATQLAALREFDDGELSVLADAVEHAVRSQTGEIDTALEGALRFIPRPLRGRARSMLFPGGGHG